MDEGILIKSILIHLRNIFCDLVLKMEKMEFGSRVATVEIACYAEGEGKKSEEKKGKEEEKVFICFVYFLLFFLCCALFAKMEKVGFGSRVAIVEIACYAEGMTKKERIKEKKKRKKVSFLRRFIGEIFFVNLLKKWKRLNLEVEFLLWRLLVMQKVRRRKKRGRKTK